MNLSKHYNELYKKSAESILAEHYNIDSKINDALDSRFGITLLIRPNEAIKSKIREFIDELKKVDPEQYYYPDTDIHITIMSIISCYEGFSLKSISREDYIEIIQQSLVDFDKLKINFRGVTASPSAVMIQGFPVDDTLDNLRNKLRENFKASSLEQSIDSRYTISTAHLTVMRFQNKLQNPEKLIAITEKFRDYDFGEFNVSKLELVHNDWYQREKNTVDLCDFYLR